MSKLSTATETVTTLNSITTHPGKVLSEQFLKLLTLSVNVLAIALRVPMTRMSAIIKKNVPNYH